MISLTCVSYSRDDIAHFAEHQRSMARGGVRIERRLALMIAAVAMLGAVAMAFLVK